MTTVACVADRASSRGQGQPEMEARETESISYGTPLAMSQPGSQPKGVLPRCCQSGELRAIPNNFAIHRVDQRVRRCQEHTPAPNPEGDDALVARARDLETGAAAVSQKARTWAAKP